MSELMFTSCDPVRLFQRHEVILQAGQAQIYHAPKANAGEPMEHMKPLTRAVIGHAYAMGGWLAAPYDLFIGAGIPRYFGKPEDFADLYGFIRANARYLDGFERAALRRGNPLASRANRRLLGAIPKPADRVRNAKRICRVSNPENRSVCVAAGPAARTW